MSLEKSLREQQDTELRDLLMSSAFTPLPPEPYDENFFRYWNDDGLEIRTCLECKISEFKSPEDGVWIIYFTNERVLWACDQIEKQNYSLDCSLCKKWFYEKTQR